MSDLISADLLLCLSAIDLNERFIFAPQVVGPYGVYLLYGFKDKDKWRISP